jgi:hypothetical protein
MTRWLVTFVPSDGGAMHVMVDSETEGRDLIATLEAQGIGGSRLEEVAATWRCDGGDGCTVVA